MRNVENIIAATIFAVILILIIYHYSGYFTLHKNSRKTAMIVQSTAICETRLDENPQLFYRIFCRVGIGKNYKYAISVYPWRFDNIFPHQSAAQLELKSVKIGDPVYKSAMLFGGYYVIPAISSKGKYKIAGRLVFITTVFLLTMLALYYLI